MKENKREYFVSDLVIDDQYDTISSTSSVKDAALLMKEKGIPDLVVVQEDESVLGIIADYDIVIGLVAAGKNGDSTKVTETMYKIAPVTLETPVETAFQRMHELDVTAVPVVDKDKGSLQGIVTITDCWGYMPDKYEDYQGLLTVSNARSANYWFTVLMTIFYFFFGILSPIVGISGFLTSNVLENANQSVTYYLFDARGGDYFIRFIDFTGDSLPWLLVSVYGIIFILIGILTTIVIIQWAYGDYHLIKQSGKDWHSIASLVAILNVVILWVLFFIILNIGAIRATNASIDFLGLLFSLISVACLILAVQRDVLFKQKYKPSAGGS